MIGKYTDEDFFEKLNAYEQHEYILKLIEGMPDDQLKELYKNINSARSKAIDKIKPEDYGNPEILSHFWKI